MFFNPYLSSNVCVYVYAYVIQDLHNFYFLMVLISSLFYYYFFSFEWCYLNCWIILKYIPTSTKNGCYKVISICCIISYVWNVTYSMNGMEILQKVHNIFPYCIQYTVHNHKLLHNKYGQQWTLLKC